MGFVVPFLLISGLNPSVSRVFKKGSGWPPPETGETQTEKGRLREDPFKAL
jgi:hypothetical protein